MSSPLAYSQFSATSSTTNILVMTTDKKPLNVREALAGASVLITGSTGFLGKVLTEKLLRSCPEVKAIYLLAREKKGRSAEARVAAIFEDPLFSVVEKECPDYREKVTAIGGDCTAQDLGLSTQDRQLLIKEVTVVFHAAATVRFDEHLRTAYTINVRATRELLLLAREFKSLKAFVHVSTAYAHCPRTEIEEVLYPPPMTHTRLENIVTSLDDSVIEVITPKLLGDWPNSYAFTKAIAESVVAELGKDLPVCIFRPAIVVGTANEPIIGWTDNLYGPTGLVVGAGCGVLRAVYGDFNCVANIVPVDMTVNALLAAGAQLVLDAPNTTSRLEGPDPLVYNYVSSTDNPLLWKEFKSYIEKHGQSIPPMRAIWCYFLVVNRYWPLHLISVYLLHYLPALLMDLFAWLTRKDTPRLVGIYRKVDKFSRVLAYFSNRSWDFKCGRVRELVGRLPEDTAFKCEIKQLNWDSFFRDYIVGLRVYLLKDPMSTLPQASRRWRLFQRAHATIKYSLLSLSLYLLYSFTSVVYSLLPHSLAL